MRKIVSIALISALMIGLAAAQTPPPVAQTEAGKKALAKIRQLGGLALELAQNDQHLEVSYIQTDGKLTDEHLALLKDLKGLVHLDLRGQPVTDAQLIHLKPLTELTRLHLENTKITDKGLENLKGLVNLEYLNLYGTNVSDAGLANLEGMKKLKHLYVWQTKVSEAGAAKIKNTIPGLDVNLGFKEAPIVAKKEEKKPEPKAVAKAPEPKKEEKKPVPVAVAKKPEPKNEVKKPEPKIELKKPEPPKDAKSGEEVTALLKSRVDLAERNYRAVFEGLSLSKKVGNVLVLATDDPEDVYKWSVRWLHAQRDLNPKQEDQIVALEAHLKRMTELKKAVTNLTRDLLPRIKEDEAEWYRLEAQIWLAKAKEKNGQAKAK